MQIRNSQSLPHRLYKRIRPALYDMGILDVARRFVSQEQRTQIAVRMGLEGFDVSSATGKRIPRWLVKRWDPRKSVKVDGINYMGDLYADLGISEWSRLIAQTLLDAKIPLTYTETPYPFPHRTNEFAHKLPEGAPYTVSIVDVNLPYFFDTMIRAPKDIAKDKYVIVIWGWELNKFPEHWLKNLQFVDEIWVYSKFVQQVIRQVTDKPAKRMTAAIDIQATPNTIPDDFGLPDDRFIFMFAFSSTSTAARKNPFGFIEAFKRAFGKPEEGPLLVIKSHHLDSPDAIKLTPALQEAVAEVGGIIVGDNFNRQQMYDLLSVADCYVSLHRSEGFGLTIAESMALGKPVIATAYSANMDYMTSQNSYLVDYELREICEDDHKYQPRLETIYNIGYKWAEPDIDHAAHLMREVYVNSEQARAVGLQAQKDIARIFSREISASKILNRLEALENR